MAKLQVPHAKILALKLFAKELVKAACKMRREKYG
jgi:hypothetical protein